VAVVFFLFFLLPSKDRVLLSPESVVVALANESAMSVVPVSFPKLQLLPVFQLLVPVLPQALNPNSLSFFSVAPKSRSSFGASSLRSILSKLLIPLMFSAAGSA